MPFRISPAALLRGAAVVFGVLGLGLTIWLIDKALRFPQVRASMLDYTAPLWEPAIGFVVAGTGLSIYVFVRAARRVDRGENLFAKRHRRHPDDARNVRSE
jgi:hypothetical protein